MNKIEEKKIYNKLKVFGPEGQDILMDLFHRIEEAEEHIRCLELEVGSK